MLEDEHTSLRLSFYAQIVAPPYGHILEQRNAMFLLAGMADVDRDAVSTIYSYYLNIVGGYYTHIICVLTNIRDLYSG